MSRGGQPRQAAFKGFFRPKAEPQRRGFDNQNRESAEIILDDVETYGGEQSAIVQWARAVVGKAEASCV